MNGKTKTKQSGAVRIMTRSNPSITTTRLAERQQITGINYRTAIQQFKHTRVPKIGETQSGVTGKHVST